MAENKFVAQFSVTEAVAVKQLKATIPDILTDVYGSDDIYTLWGVELDAKSDDERLLVVLIKFLRENELDITKAKEMLINTLTWRKEMSVDDISDEKFDHDVFNDNVGCIYKNDKEGRPVIYNFYGGIDQEKVFGDIERFIRWRIQLLEEAIQHIDFIHTDATTQVHDYKGASIFGRTANTKEATSRLIQTTKNYYPGFLASLFT
ncbi:hypothetical protein K501DRAFT_293946 [Backusella circina FSU 941]|nr:hypothetical protein K501DRAFT_293946 [Backusella circina FSU 941]